MESAICVTGVFECCFHMRDKVKVWLKSMLVKFGAVGTLSAENFVRHLILSERMARCWSRRVR